MISFTGKEGSIIKSRERKQDEEMMG